MTYYSLNKLHKLKKHLRHHSKQKIKNKGSLIVHHTNKTKTMKENLQGDRSLRKDLAISQEKVVKLRMIRKKIWTDQALVQTDLAKIQEIKKRKKYSLKRKKFLRETPKMSNSNINAITGEGLKQWLFLLKVKKQISEGFYNVYLSLFT